MKKSDSRPGLRLVKSSKKEEPLKEVQVSIEITNDDLTDQERAMLLKGTKSLLQDVFAKTPGAGMVVIDDIQPDTHKTEKKVKSNKIINLSEKKSKRKNRKE